MSLQLPRAIRASTASDALDPLQHEIAQEKALSLGRAAQLFEAALRAYLAASADTTADPTAPQRILDEAGEALWAFVVQREACGLRDTDAVMRAYAVPPAVRLRMGVRGGRAGSRV